MAGSLSLSLDCSLNYLECKCGTISFDSSSAIKKMRLKVRRIEALQETSSFYGTESFSIASYLKFELDAPFIMHRLQLLQMDFASD